MAQTAGPLEVIVVDLLVHAPFFGHVLAGIDKRVVAGDVARICTRGARFVLEVGDALLARATGKQARGVLKHELLHLLLEHPFRRADFADPTRFDLAADLVVGSLLDPDERGPWDTLPSDLPELHLPDEATVETYYSLLPGGESAPDGARDHDGWGALSEGSDVEQALRLAFFRDLVETAHVQTSQHGSIPGAIERALADLLDRRASVSWRTVIRRFRATADHTRVVGTMHRPSRRYGTVPGTKIRRLSRLVAVVDTSGSVTEHDLAAFSTELSHLARTGCDVWVIYCDARVQGEEPFRGALLERVPGGGGTAFDPGLRAAADRDPDGIVYLTDGLGGPVTVRPRCPLLWVLTPDGRDPASPETRELLRGRIVRMRVA